jgi:molybdopterin-guanine dinucleotide biosynthesis protein A
VTGAVLLAGGRSERMGRDKPTLQLGGEPLVARHVRQLRLAGVERFLLIANETNRAAVTAAVEGPGVMVIPQAAAGAEGAVLTGLRRTNRDEPQYIVCTNDIVPDDTYVRLARSPEVPIQVVTARARERFVGGLTVFAKDRRVTRIDERPAGGCPPGSWANVFIHRFASEDLLRELARLLALGAAYESALNEIMGSTEALAVPVERWVAIKEPHDLERARRAFVR